MQTCEFSDMNLGDGALFPCFGSQIDHSASLFDMSNVRIFKEIEKKKIAAVYTLLCLRSAELSKPFGLKKYAIPKYL